jgi:serine protease
MATPHVAGLASLAWSYRPELSYSDIKNTLLSQGDSLLALSGKTVSGKRINAYTTLYSLTPAPV